MIDAAIEHFGTFDILVNSAGIMRTIRRALPIFIKKKQGVIINLGAQGFRTGLAYTASKHAVVGMTKNIGFQYANEGVRCNAIAPGAGKADEIAGIALFLASEDAAFVNGEVIRADDAE